MATRPGRRPRGALEQQVLACLAAANRPLTPGEVLADLGDDLAYTTVMTTLSRLHDKGSLDRRAAGRGYAYSLVADPAATRAALAAQQMHRLLASGDDRAGVLARFVAGLGPDDERVLAELLTELLTEPGEPGEPDEPGADRPSPRHDGTGAAS